MAQGFAEANGKALLIPLHTFAMKANPAWVSEKTTSNLNKLLCSRNDSIYIYTYIINKVLLNRNV